MIFSSSQSSLFSYYGNEINADQKVVKVGVILPLTGTSADGGKYVKEGLLLALKKINTNPKNKRIELYFEDSQYKPELAVTAAKKLINAERINFIIGPYGSSEVLAVAPVSENSKVILMVFASSSDISNAGDYVFRTAASTQLETKFFSKYLIGVTGGQEISIIAFNTALGTSYVKDFSSNYINLGGRINNVQFFGSQETDFSTHLLNLKKSKYILIIANRKQSGLIMKQAKELGMNNIFFSSSFVEGQEFLDTAKEAGEGLIYPYPFDDDSNDPTQKSFQEEYFSEYGRKSEMFASEAYDGLMILNNCFNRAGVEVDAVKDCVYQTQNYFGASGTIGFDSNGDVSKNFIIKTVKNGRFVKSKLN